MAFNPYYGYTPQYGRNPYIQQPIATPQYQPQTTDYMNQMQNAYQKPLGLQGKTVDNIEVVKATDIPLDGSISYFPLVDGSSIITKQLQADGTSRMIVYKPVETTPKTNTTENKEIYVTEKQLEEKLKTFNNEELKQEIEKLKKQIKDLTSNSKK
jgi:hypothetical protein